MDSSNSGFEDNEQRKRAYIRKLQDDIYKLPADKKQRVVNIIAKDIDFVQVHLIELKPSTLKKLEKYTKSCLEEMTHKPENDNQEAGTQKMKKRSAKKRSKKDDNQVAGTQEMKKRSAKKRAKKDEVKTDGAGRSACSNNSGKGLFLSNIHN